MSIALYAVHFFRRIVFDAIKFMKAWGANFVCDRLSKLVIMKRESDTKYLLAFTSAEIAMSWAGASLSLLLLKPSDSDQDQNVAQTVSASW